MPTKCNKKGENLELRILWKIKAKIGWNRRDLNRPATHAAARTERPGYGVREEFGNGNALHQKKVVKDKRGERKMY